MDEKMLYKYLDEKFTGVHKKIDDIKMDVVENTKHRIEAVTTFNIFKWAIGFVGLGTLSSIIIALTK